MGIILHIKQFKVISRNRASTQSVLRGVSDGSKCWITLTATENIPISHCFLCTGENCPHIIYLQPQQQQKFCLRLGLAPDLSDSLRGAIENALQTLNVGSTAVIEVKLSEHSSCQVTAHLDGFSAPQAFYPTPVNDEEEEKNQPTLRKKAATGDNVEATSSHGNGTNIAWRTSTPRLWFAQASVLKARGSSLFNSAPRGDAHNLSPIIAAFACYSRALQLVTLIGAALDLSVRAEEVEKEKEACEVTFGLVGGDYIDLDGDAQYSVDPERVEVDVEAMEKVHFRGYPTPVRLPIVHHEFDVELLRLQHRINLGSRGSLLSNMALCQLKAGCPAYAVKLCTQALEIAPQDNTLLAASQEVDEEEEEEGGRGIDLRDVEKVLYRRASAYLLMEEFEAGIEDANRLLQLNPTNQAGEKVLHELQASLRAHNATMARMMKKAFQ